jgi:hypothetical protein
MMHTAPQGTRSYRTALLLALVATSATSARAQEPTHIIDKGARSQGAVPPSTLESRLQGVVRQYAGRQIYRIAMYDAAFPRDSTEYTALNGGALLLVVAVAESPVDLPLKTLVALHDSVRTVLVPLSQNTYEVPAGTYGAVLGRFRSDAFYLVPADVWESGAQLIADFPTRPGFALGGLSGPASGTYPSSRPGAVAADSAVKELWTREFPGFTHP